MKHEKYSLGYDVLRVYARFMHRLIHRRIVIRGIENIPENVPVVFAPNHQNALMDAMAVLLATPGQPTWLARADIFKNNFISKILYFLKISPVYRIRDGKESLGKNEEVFELSIRVLKNNKSLAVFPEAMHTFKRQSAAHKKAVPRIAFMAEERENFNLGLQIIPVGLYYSHYNDLNRELLVTFGKPIFLKDYESLYRENPGTATIALRNDLYAKLVPLTIHISDKSHYEEFETLREIFINSLIKEKDLAREVKKQQALLEDSEKWTASHPEEAEGFFSDLHAYRSGLERTKLSDESLSQKSAVWKTIGRSLLSAISLPLFLYGLVNFFLGFYLPSYLIRKKIRDRVFWATIEYVAWIMFIPLFSLIQFAVLWIVTGNFLISAVYLVTLPFFGKVALNLSDLYSKTLHGLKVMSGGKQIRKLQMLRKGILEMVRNIL